MRFVLTSYEVPHFALLLIAWPKALPSQEAFQLLNTSVRVFSRAQSSNTKTTFVSFKYNCHKFKYLIEFFKLSNFMVFPSKPIWDLKWIKVSKFLLFHRKTMGRLNHRLTLGQNTTFKEGGTKNIFSTGCGSLQLKIFETHSQQNYNKRNNAYFTLVTPKVLHATATTILLAFFDAMCVITMMVMKRRMLHCRLSEVNFICGRRN